MLGLKLPSLLQLARQNMQLKDLRFTSPEIFGAVTYIGLLIFVLALPFGYSTAFLNIGLSFVLLGWVGRLVSERKLGWQRTSLDLPILLFLGLGLIASLLAPNPDTSSLGYFWKHLRAILLFYAVIHSRLGTRWRQVVIAFIATAGISSALGLWYYANDTRLAIDFMGRIGLQFQEELAAGGVPNLQISDELRTELRNCNVPLSQTASFVPSKQPGEWRINDLVRNRRYTVRKSETHLMVYMIEQRLTGTFKMPNDLGAYLALMLPFVMGYFVGAGNVGQGMDLVYLKTKSPNPYGITSQLERTETRRKSRRPLIWATVGLGVILALMSANLVLTLTRAAWISVVLAVVFVGCYFAICRGWVTQPLRCIPWKRSLLGLALISVVFCVLIVNTNSRQAMIGIVPQHIKERIQTLIAHPAGFMSERPQWWRTSLQMIRKYPLTGIGLGRFRYEYQHNGPDAQYDTPYHAHNIYLHIATEQGIPSLFVFLWIVAIICRQVFVMRTTNDLWELGTFIGASGFLISALVYGLADNILHQRTVLLFWFIIGIIFFTQQERHSNNRYL